MKLNLDYYKDLEKNKLTEEEDQIISKYFKSEGIKELEELLDEKSSIEEISAISDNRKNIISFYPITKEDTVLEIGTGFGEITGELCQKAKRVVSIEAKKEKAEAVSNRYKDISNLEMIVGELKNIKLEEKFDYITIIGNVENDEELGKILKIVKANLKLDGKILIAINNKFGLV